MKYLFLLGMGSFLLGCDGFDAGFDEPTPAGDDPTFVGPGPFWELQLDDEDDEFRLFKRDTPTTVANAYSISGVREELDSGFTLLTVESVSENTEPPPVEVDDQLAIINVNDNHIFLIPFEDPADSYIALIQENDCATINLNKNWIIYGDEDSRDVNDETNDFFGTLNFDLDNNSLVFDNRFPLTEIETPTALEEDITLELTECEDGVSSDNTNDHFHNGNISSLTNTENNTLVIAMPIADAISLDNISGRFIGIAFDESLEATNKSRAVSTDCTNGNCPLLIDNDVADNSTDIDGPTLNLTSLNSPNNGFILGTIEEGDDLGNIACISNQSFAGGEQDLLLCVGQAPSSNDQLFSLILRSN